MLLLLPHYLDNRENFETDKKDKKDKKDKTDDTEVEKTTSVYVILYLIFSLIMFCVSFYLNWRDNQPISVILVCAFTAFANGFVYFIFIVIYYAFFYTKHNYNYVEFSKGFDTNNLKLIEIKEIEKSIIKLLPKLLPKPKK
jgi:hypothetical protein